MMTKFIIYILLSLTPLMAASDVTLPRPSGPYSVGTKAIEVSDPSRSLLRGNKARRWLVQAYYPTNPHQGTYPYMPGTVEDGRVEEVTVRAHAQPEASILTNQKFPVIIFLPGRGNLRQQYTILLEELASQGYIVLAMDQPYVASYVKFPDGQVRGLAFKDAWYVPRDRDYRYAYDDAVIAAAMQDVDYLLKHKQVLGDIAEHWLGEKCILMGHSLGANVAHHFGFQDTRIQAVVDIDSKITDRKVFGYIGVPENESAKPVLFARGMKQYQADVGDQLTHIKGATIWGPEVEHSAFSDHAFLAAKISGFGQWGFWRTLTNWFFKQGPYWSAVDTGLGGQAIEHWVVEYRHRVVNWLENNTK